MRRRIALAAVLAAGLILGTTGCGLFAPQATLIPYDASDGVSVNVGALEVRNALVISPKGTDGALVGVFINTSKKALTVDLDYTTHSSGTAKTFEQPIELEPGEVISFGNPGVKQLVLNDLNVEPGSLVKVYIAPAGVAGKNVLLPVLINSDGVYNGDAPSPTPSPTLTIAPIPTKSPTP